MKKYPDIELDFLLPIGASCQTRYQIERFLKDFGVKQPSCFFDWLGLGGIQGVKKMIESEFSLTPNDFVIKSMYSKNNFTPIHEPTGFRFQHDFGMTPAIKKSEEKAYQTMQENMQETLNKYRYLANRTHKILSSGKTIGLVYHGRTKLEYICDLLGLLKNNYQSEFYLINVMNIDAEQQLSHDKVLSLVVDNSKVKGIPSEWQGDNNSWNEVLSSLKIKTEYYDSLK